MKTMIILMCAGFLSVLSAQAQFFNSSHVPGAVKMVFNRDYPKAKHVNWTKLADGYQAKFDSHHKTYFALYDPTGKTLAEVVEINKARLPHRVKRQLRDNYTTFAIEDALKIKSNDGKVTYETFIGGTEEAYDLLFNASGYLLSTEPIEKFPTEN